MSDRYFDFLPLVDAEPQPWDDAAWTCCGQAECRFVSKCRDTERLDAAWHLFLATKETE